ncbi:ATP-binding cassette domain-containing protein [Xanthomonas theicola]|uniref:ABC transporter n=1 Tax=Xanthomonas theicola TaxID=56464 RepID=A0A2S6ZLB5_9XANT|nr:ABC transporter ATP-binding protein [Xanthomonas theicola]PPT93082.1 ABC transporter [Xanthomonas theicola]QNH24032.1 ABC transporter ATP-binding protein [Xanthomonas theicola]
MHSMAMAAADPAGLDMDLPLAAHDLHLAFGASQVLQGVDLQVARGEVVGLIGRNGAGKSTLLACLLGLLQPQRGQARMFGGPALRLDDARKGRLGFVPQQPQAFGWMRVEELLAFATQLYPNWDAPRADALLRRWDLDRRQRIGTLSPGQAQRLALLRALAARPALLVLDEPASALDPVARRDLMREIVTQTCDEGTTVLFSSHIVSDLERVASRVAFLHQGRLLLDQPLDELKDNVLLVTLPATAAALLGDAVLRGEFARRRSADGGTAVLLHVSEPPSALLSMPGVRIDRLGLEDLFIEVAG